MTAGGAARRRRSGSAPAAADPSLRGGGSPAALKGRLQRPSGAIAAGGQGANSSAHRSRARGDSFLHGHAVAREDSRHLRTDLTTACQPLALGLQSCQQLRLPGPSLAGDLRLVCQSLAASLRPQGLALNALLVGTFAQTHTGLDLSLHNSGGLCLASALDAVQDDGLGTTLFPGWDAGGGGCPIMLHPAGLLPDATGRGQDS
mmetsp:Transcript_109955/g.245680  ORF Transcript_109955/g.245680 Transcript_109955/m.245680 type:complete len:203 (-) Transcript_109955:1163-1771(-)